MLGVHSASTGNVPAGGCRVRGCAAGAQRGPGLGPGNVWSGSHAHWPTMRAQRRPGLGPGNVRRRDVDRALCRNRSTKAGSQTRQRPRRGQLRWKDGRLAQRRPGLRPGNVLTATHPPPPDSSTPLNEGRVSDPATSVDEVAGHPVGLLRSTKAGSQTRQRPAGSS